MPREQAHAFDRDTALGVADMYSDYRRSPRGRSPSQYTPPAPSGGECVLLRITSATPTGGLYPCVPLFWDYVAGYSDGDEAWALMPNSETPVDERRYLGRRMTVKAADGKLVYAVAHSSDAVPASLVDDGIILNTYQLVGGLKDWRGGAYAGGVLLVYQTSDVTLGGGLTAGYSAPWNAPTYPAANAGGLAIISNSGVDGGGVIGFSDSTGMLLAAKSQFALHDGGAVTVFHFKGDTGAYPDIRLSDGTLQVQADSGTFAGLEFTSGWLTGGAFSLDGETVDGGTV